MTTTPDSPAHPIKRRIAAAGLVALVLFHAAVNVWWLSRDNAPQVGDPGSHLEAAKVYHRVLTNPNEPSFVKRVAGLRHIPLGFYPPLVYIMGAFSALIFGPSTMGFALVNTLVFAALIAAAYALARSMLPPLGALVAAFTVSMMPFLFGISRLFLLDLLSAFFVVLFFVVLLKTDRFQRPGWVIVLGVINVLGFWARWTTPLYYAVPLALVAYWALRDATRSSESRWKNLRSPAGNLCVFAAISALGIGAWFLRQTSGIVSTYEQNFAPIQKSISLFDPLVWISYPILVNNTGTFLLLSLLAIAGMVVTLSRRPIPRATLLLILWPLASIILLTLLAPIRNHAPRYIVPMLPALGIFAAVAVCAIPRRPVRIFAIAATAAVLIFQFVNITFVTLGSFEIPVTASIQWQARPANQGVVVFDSKVDASGAKFGPPFRDENWIQRALGAIVEADTTTYSVRNQDAKILLIGARRESISNVQRDYWPVADPLRNPTRVRRVVGQFVPSENVHIQAGHGPNFGSWENYLGVAWPLPVEFHLAPDPQGVSAFSAAFAASTVPPEYAYLAQAGHVAHVPNNTKRFIMHPVSVPILQLSLGAQADTSATTTLERLGVYRQIPQPRPAALNEVVASIDRITPEAVERVEYIVWAAPEPVEDLPTLFEGFERLVSFEAGVFGHWQPRHFEVLWRRPRNVITLETCDTLHIQTTNDAPDGRWDIPWYRYPWWTAVDNPERWAYWAAESPAHVYVYLGREYAVDGIEILPYSAEEGVESAHAEYWDGATYIPLGQEQIVLSDPVFEDGERVLYHHPYPAPWEIAVTTDQIRFTFESPTRVAIANIFIYHQ